MSTRHRLLEVATVKPGYLAREGVQPKESGSHYLLQVRDFSQDRTELHMEGLVRFVPESLSSTEPVQPGDIVFMAKGANNFAYAVSTVPIPTLAAGYFFIVRPSRNILPEYLAWYLNQEPTKRELSRLATSGVRMPVVRKAVLENMEIPIPPVAVQRKIVEAYRLMLNEQQLITELAEKKRMLMSMACLKAACGV